MQDWVKFKAECHKLAKAGMTIRDIMRQTGGDHDDVCRAVFTD